MRHVVRSFATASLCVLFACGEGKLPEPGLDYGPEDGAQAAKDDSATSPSSMAQLSAGRALYTTFTASARWRAFKLTATAGKALDIFVDGRNGLDTVAFVYNVSATTGRPYGRPIAQNDDTERAGWSTNPNSSSIEGFVPMYSRTYAIVVTTYRQTGRGTAQVVVRPAAATASGTFTTGPAGAAVTIDGHSALPMGVAPTVDGLVGTANGFNAGPPIYAAAYRFRPADLATALSGDAQPIIGAAYSASLGPQGQYVPGPSVSAAPVDVRLGTAAVDEFVQYVFGNLDPATGPRFRAAMGDLAAALVRDGATHVFQTHMDNGDDMSYDGLVAADARTGDVRIVGVRNDP